MRKTLLGTVLSLTALTAWAQTDHENWMKCKSNDPDFNISGCTALIQSGQESPANLPVFYWHRASAYLDKELYDEVIADCSKAIALNPDFVNPYITRGIAYEVKGNNDRAIADFTRLIALQPNDATGYTVRGTAYHRNGQREKAIVDFRSALKIDPGDQYAKDHLESLGAAP